MHIASHQLLSVRTSSVIGLEKYNHAFSAFITVLISVTIFLLSNKKLPPNFIEFKELFLQTPTQKKSSKFSGAEGDKSRHLATSFIVAKPFQPSGFGMKSRRGSPPPSLVRIGALRNIFIFWAGA